MAAVDVKVVGALGLEGVAPASDAEPRCGLNGLGGEGNCQVHLDRVFKTAMAPTHDLDRCRRAGRKGLSVPRRGAWA